MNIKNISPRVIEGFDGNGFITIAPGESKEFPAAVVKRMQLVERGLVVSAETVVQKPAAPDAHVAPPAPAYKTAPRAKLDETDA